MRDDFVAPPELLYASIGNPEQIDNTARDAIERYRQEASVVDSRLVRNVTISLKHASMTEICAELTRQTGVQMAAGRNARDENATIFVSSRPAREVMPQISLVFGFVWEREGEDGAYTYRLKQTPESLVAEEKQRNDDVTQAINALTHRVRNGAAQAGNLEDACRRAFAELLPDELDRLRSGLSVAVASKPVLSQGQLDSDLTTTLLKAMGGIKPVLDSYTATADLNDPDLIPFTQMRDSGANVTFRMKLTEFGGASLAADASAYGSTDKFGPSSWGRPVKIGTVDGAAESPVDNAKSNVALRNDKGMSEAVDLKPVPTVPLADQTFAPEAQNYTSIATLYASYRLAEGLQPPRPYMTSDDLWQSVHAATGRDVIADSYSRLFRLTGYKGELFDVLNQACDAMHLRWSKSDGWLVGRSQAYCWQRTNEVPKEKLATWLKLRKQSHDGCLPIQGLIEMSSLDDRQLDAISVGMTIVNQWNLPEWGIVSRPLWPFGTEPIRPLVRFLGELPPDQLQAILNHELPVSSVSEASLELGHIADIPRDALLGIDYVPPGKFFWNPVFESGKEEVHTDLIIGDTEEAVEAEIQKRYPGRPHDEVTPSDGTLTLLIYTKDRTQTRGDLRFAVGHRFG